MSEVREAVRSRYASVARQIAVIPNPSSDTGAGCCQADGPDCGCSGSYSAEDLKAIGLSRVGQPRLRQSHDARAA